MPDYAVGSPKAFNGAQSMISALLLCAAARVVDGDTIYCSGVGRIRMVAIDAPDKTYSAPCRRHYGNHVCDNEKALAATEALVRATTGRRITYRITGYDTRNHRPVAQMFAKRTDLQCLQLRLKTARYLPSYDTGRWIVNRCPATVRRAFR
jgi:micrococcal nuclease